MGNGALSTPEGFNTEDLDKTNVALVFVKPHANSSKVRDFVTGRLTESGLSIIAEGDISAEKIEKDKVSTGSSAALRFFVAASICSFPFLSRIYLILYTDTDISDISSDDRCSLRGNCPRRDGNCPL